MKKTIITVIVAAFTINISYAQWTAGSGGNYYLNSGNAGIGTTTPSALLHTNSMVANTILGRFDTQWYNRGLDISCDAYSIYLQGKANVGSTPINYVLSLNPNGGNVGIGTTSPAALLSVGSSSQFQVNAFGQIATLLYTNLGSFTGYRAQGSVPIPVFENIAAYGDANEQSLIQGGNEFGGTHGTYLRFLVNSNATASTPVTALQINPNGRVQIGSTISGTFGLRPQLTVQSTTEQLRLNYDASNYSSFTVDSTGMLTITPTGAVTNINGNVGIGTITPDAKLTVNGTVHAKEVLVDLNIFPDYVFKSTYHLPTLTDVKTYIDQNHHLPDMPTEAEVVKNGLKVGETEALLTKKVEEVTLYLIQQKEEITQLKRQISNLKRHRK